MGAVRMFARVLSAGVDFIAPSRAVNTTAPITGGGDLSADRTIAIPAATTGAAGHMTAAHATTLAAADTTATAALPKAGGAMTGAIGMIYNWLSATGQLDLTGSEALGYLQVRFRNTAATTSAGQAGMDFGFSDSRRVTLGVGGDTTGSPYSNAAYFNSIGNSNGIRMIAAGATPFEVWTNATKRLSVSSAGLLTAFYGLTVAGDVKVDTTITAPGTTGNQTINKTSGRVNMAAAGATLVVTNSLVTANSIVLCVIATADATCRLQTVVPAAGSFTINTVAATAETAISFLVLN